MSLRSVRLCVLVGRGMGVLLMVRSRFSVMRPLMRLSMTRIASGQLARVQANPASRLRSAFHRGKNRSRPPPFTEGR